MAAKKATRRPARRTRPTPRKATGRKTGRKKAAPRAATKRAARRAARPSSGKKRALTTKTRRQARRTPARRPDRRPRTAKTAASRPAPAPPAPSPAPPPRRQTGPVALDRARRHLPDDERYASREPPDDRMMAAVRSGGDELRHILAEHTEAGPMLTAGDVDARWDDAYAVGDEAPGGDNPTPDQDRVDEIGKALGVNYADSEELQASDKIAERDRHRWELDPASSDDWPHDRDKS
jgi:hypothetical protein